MKIGITYDLREAYLAEGYGEEETAELDRPDTIEAIEGSLGELGYETERIGHARNLVTRLAAGDSWDLVFNIAEGLRGYGREAQVPALLDLYDIPYTFSDPLVLSLSLHKAMTKRVIRDLGLPTPEFTMVESEEDLSRARLPFPLFVKPVAEGTGKGISCASKVSTPGELERVCRDLLHRFKQPVLVEMFLPGREFTVGMVGTGADARAVGVMEVLFRSGAEGDIYSYANKEHYERRIEYALVRGPLGERAREVALGVWRGLGCRDAGRVDLRADDSGAPSFMEVNPLAGLHPVHSDLPIVCSMVGMDYKRLIESIVNSARHRMEEMKVVVLHSEVAPEAAEDEQDVLVQVRAVSLALRHLGYEPEALAFSMNMKCVQAALRAARPAFVFNLVETVEGSGRFIHTAPALLDHMGILYTGTLTEGLFMTSNKLIAKNLLAGSGIPTPPWCSVEDLHRGKVPLTSPVIIKSVWEHASIGLDESSVIVPRDPHHLAVEMMARRPALGGSCFAEAYIEGRELNISLLTGSNGPEVLPAAEMLFSGLAAGSRKLMSYRAKWDTRSPEYRATSRSFAQLPEDASLIAELEGLARSCWELFGLRGYARVDFRVDEAGKPQVLEVNANPCLSPDAGFVAATEQAGMDFAGVVKRIVADGIPFPKTAKGYEER